MLLKELRINNGQFIMIPIIRKSQSLLSFWIILIYFFCYFKLICADKT